MSAVGGLDPETNARLMVLERTYQDIYSFGRYLDEKLRSLITALAFWTVAGITLFISTKPNDLTFDGHSWNSANVFFLWFLVDVFLCLSSALVAMDPTSHRPHFLGDRTPRASALYYQAIIDDPWWRDGGKQTAQELGEKLAESYRTDTYALARRWDHKVQRTQAAQAFMSVTMIALIALAVTRLPLSSASTRATILVFGLASAAWLPGVTFAMMWWKRFSPIGKGELKWTLRSLANVISYYVIPPTVTTTLLVLSWKAGRPYWPSIFFAMFWVMGSRLSTIYVRQWRITIPTTVFGAGLVGLLLLAPNSVRERPTVEASHLRTATGNILCVRIHTGAREQPKTRVVVRMPGGTVASVSRKLNLSGNQIVSFKVKRPGWYDIEVHVRPTDLSVVRIHYLVPTLSEPAQGPFSCRLGVP
ncbi:MAG: hypothetical protein ABSB96_05115 [Gaiellaceae bacterium]